MTRQSDYPEAASARRLLKSLSGRGVELTFRDPDELSDKQCIDAVIREGYRWSVRYGRFHKQLGLPEV